MGNVEPLARTYPAGVTCWVECEQPDVAAAVEFYGGLFGWQPEDLLPEGAPRALRHRHARWSRRGCAGGVR